MPKRSLLVLANSYKKQPGRCIAGIEVDSEKVPLTGRWIRPISQDRAEGELLPRHRRVTGGAQIAPLDIVSVPVTESANNAAHPEDWFVTADEPWEIVATVDNSLLATLIETPPNLWLQPNRSSDRVSAEFIAASSTHRSIFLVKPVDLRLRLWREYDAWQGYVKRKLRVVFTYNATLYEFSLTDPVSSARFAQSFPAEGEAPVELRLPKGDSYALCVSLTPALNGLHYKVVATILELP